MNNNENILKTSEIKDILVNNNFLFDKIEVFQKNNKVDSFLLDNKYILKVSKNRLTEQAKLDRINFLSLVPKIRFSGHFSFSNCNCNYLIIDYIKGNELFSDLSKLNDEQSKVIGKEIAQFLIELHKIDDSFYDIGHYIPTIPRYSHSWKEGHLEYIKLLKNGLSKLNLILNSENVITLAFNYIFENISCLDYQVGPRLLHNDFHPKNIIINEGRLSGIIDWECSQYGEIDFELTHLFQWCIYPPQENKGFEILLKTVFENFMNNCSIPNIKERLTIYQLEHELNQLIWNGVKQEEERVQRINGWLNGKISDLITKWETV